MYVYASGSFFIPLSVYRPQDKVNWDICSTLCFKKTAPLNRKKLVQVIYTYDWSYSKCSECCPLALTQASSHFLHWSMASFVKIILFIYIQLASASVLLLPWKPCSWYSIHTKRFKHNESTTEWQCTVWKIILGELILMNLCRPGSGVRFFRNTVYIWFSIFGYWHQRREQCP